MFYTLRTSLTNILLFTFVFTRTEFVLSSLINNVYDAPWTPYGSVTLLTQEIMSKTVEIALANIQDTV